MYIYIYIHGFVFGVEGVWSKSYHTEKERVRNIQWIHRVGGIVCQGTQDAKRFPDFELQHSILVQLYSYR